MVRTRAGSSLLFLLVVFSFCANALAGPAATPLTTIAAIRDSGLQTSRAGRPVHVRAVVTYYDNVAPNLFVQDRTGGIWVDLRGLKATPPRPGQLLDLRGTVGLGFTPYIAQPRWTSLGIAPLPRPIPLSYDQAITGRYDSQWAQIDGVVRSFSKQAEGDVLVMDVAAPMGSFKVRVPNYRAAFPMHLVDATVRFQGVCGSSFNRRNQLVSVHLMMPSLGDLRILTPAPADPFAIPASPIASIRRFTTDVPDRHRVKVVGTITAHFPGRGLFLADSSGGVYVQTQDGAPVQPGDEVEVIGFPAAGSYSPILKSGVLRPTGRHFAQRPLTITGAQALGGGYDAQLVTLRGVVRSNYSRLTSDAPLSRPGSRVLVIETPDYVTFEAFLPRSVSPKWGVPVGSQVALTGICTVKADENGNPSQFQVILRSAADARLLSSPPWLTLRRALSMLSLLAAITAAIIGWVVVLRRRVARQTQLIQARLASEAALEERYRRVFQRNIAGLYIAEPDGTIIDCNEACARFLGFVGREHLLSMKESTRDIVRQFWTQEGLTDSLVNVEQRFQRHDGTSGWALSNARCVPGGHIEGALVDITDRKLADEQVKFLAFYDALTGLPNRALLQDRLSKTLANARRNREKVAVLFLDIDRFKNINDSLGHSHGDRLLQKVARRLELCAREEDTVARLGGDEFLIVLGSIAAPADAASIAERICHDISIGFEVHGQVLSITASIGISLYPEHGGSAEALIKDADAAMYRAKEEGRNCFRFFSEEMTAQATERLVLENSLRTALEENQFFLRFQPEFDLATGAIVACEALLRWNHPALGPVAPDRFIPVAEATGMILPIGEWVLRTACMEARKWQTEGQIALPVAVNVSAVQLRQPGFCAMVESVLDQTGLDPRFLEIELTESLLLDHHSPTFDVFRSLEALGVNLTIDDFGTGYSSLSYLKQFPVRKLKIDRSFIRDLDIDPDNAAITAAIIHMAKCLQIKAIAEGVENEIQLSLLRNMACDQVQGFLLSEPLSAARIPSRVRENASSALLGAAPAATAATNLARPAAPPRHIPDESIDATDPLPEGI